MNLDEEQRKRVSEWIAQGLKLSDIQARIAAELGFKLTYMDVRLLVDDLKLTPKDVELPKPGGSALETSSTAATGHPAAPAGETAAKAAGSVSVQVDQIPRPAAQSDPLAKAAGSVSVQVDQIARPGAVVSGKVTFSDGNRAEWYFDQM